MFQFLIGNLQTALSAVVPLVINLFQFLIGNLQTLFLPLIAKTDALVSIPYR